MQMDTWNCQVCGIRGICSKHWLFTGNICCAFASMIEMQELHGIHSSVV